MTRVSDAAAVTLQTWSRTVLAKKEAEALQHLKLMDQSKAKSLASSEGASMELWMRRFLIVAACITLVGAIPSSAGDGPQVMATSSTVHETGQFKLFSLVAGALPSLLHSR